MTVVDRDDPDKRRAVFDFTDHQRPPKSPDPYSDYIRTYAQVVRKDMNKQQNQNPNPPTSSRAPTTNIGTSNGGGRGPNTSIGSTNGGGRAPNTTISSANGGGRAPNTTIGNANGDGWGLNTNIGSGNGGSVPINTPPSTSSSSSLSIPLQFGNLKYDPSLLSSSNLKFAINPPQLTSSSSSSSEARISSTDFPKLQRLIKLAIDAGRLRSKCRNCGNSVQHCCEQTILEAVSSLPPPPSNS
ncbi:white-opaque regulator 1-like [Tripterygium wilfordii]|uniref:white-opaque regulator 1-like n=1 Tax=Tripterygium wilfordii TaxID=458696 RepID=UPI0018F824C3|nr:white-opaque regulator 1-like [Tripterygium wilfordii]